MRRRNMYYATGQPGWMRLGYSPGWVGRSPNGLGPCAQYLAMGQGPASLAGGPAAAPVAVGADRQQRVAFLQAQVSLLEQQLEALRRQLEALEQG